MFAKVSPFIVLLFIIFFQLVSLIDATPVPVDAGESLNATTVLEARAPKGDATWYNTGLGACGFTDTDDKLVAALPYGKYNNGQNCNRWVKVTYGKKSVRAQVRDLCPGCGPNDVDLTPAAFQRLAPLSKGRIRVTVAFTN